MSSAAFRRLCIETDIMLLFLTITAAAFRRLCIETVNASSFVARVRQPPSGGCVLKLYIRFHHL